jgi:hypothetical protein
VPGYKNYMKPEISSLNSRLSVLESSTKVRMDSVLPSPESQEDEIDREDGEISVAPGGKRYLRYVPHEGVDPRP